MPNIANHRIVDFPIADIYKIVHDIEAYPTLLSFIRKVTILTRQQDRMTARVSVGLPMLSFSYDCLIDCKENDFIKITLLSGPFKKLHALWRFAKIDANRTRIDYSLDSEFKNPVVEMTAGAIFASQLNHAIDAFAARLRKA